MWGHAAHCSCGLCTSLLRLHRLIGERSGVQGFIPFRTLRLRNLLGELDDWLEQQPAAGISVEASKGTCGLIRHDAVNKAQGDPIHFKMAAWRAQRRRA